MDKFLVAIFLGAAILMPPISLGGSLPILRPELLVVGAAFFLGGSRLRINFSRRDPVWQILLLLMPIAVLAIGSSYAFLGTPFYYRDFMVLAMLVQYWLVYCFARSIQGQEARQVAVQTFVACVGATALVGLAQKYNLAGVNTWLTPLYMSNSDRDQVMLLALRRGLDFGRSVGTVGDPQHYSFVLALGFVGALSLQLLQSRWTLKRIPGLTILGCIFLATILAASRTGGIVILISTALVVYFVVNKRRNAGRVLALTVIFGVMAIAIWSVLAPDEAKQRLTAMDTRSFQHGLGARQRDALEPFKKGLRNPLIFITGHGPSKAILPSSEHSDMGWVLLRYGFPGFGCYLFLLVGGLRQGLRRYRSAVAPRESAAALFYMVSMVAWLLFAQAESVFKTPQLMSLNIFALGVLFGPVRMSSSRQWQFTLRSSSCTNTVSATAAVSRVQNIVEHRASGIQH